MSDFSKALMITAVPIVVLSVVSQVGYKLAGGRGWYGGASMFWFYLWVVPALLVLIAVVRSVLLHSEGEKEKASGTLAGMGIGIVSLGLSCFANMQ